MHPVAFSWQKRTLPSQVNKLTCNYVLFRIEKQLYAMPLDYVVRAVRMVAIIPVPEMPDWMPGIINIAGQTVPVIDLRRIFSQESREPGIEDYLLIIRIDGETMAVVVDQVLDIKEFASEQIESPHSVLSRSPILAATIRLDNALVMVVDAHRLFSQALKDSSSGTERHDG